MIQRDRRSVPVVLKDGKKVTLTAGEEIILTTEDIVGDAKRVHINYNGLNEDVKEGNVNPDR